MANSKNAGRKPSTAALAKSGSAHKPPRSNAPAPTARTDNDADDRPSVRPPAGTTSPGVPPKGPRGGVPPKGGKGGPPSRPPAVPATQGNHGPLPPTRKAPPAKPAPGTASPAVVAYSPPGAPQLGPQAQTMMAAVARKGPHGGQAPNVSSEAATRRNI